MTVMKALLAMALAKGNNENTFLYELNVGFFGIHCIGSAINAPFDLNDVEIIQYRGIVTTNTSRDEPM